MHLGLEFPSRFSLHLIGPKNLHIFELSVPQDTLRLIKNIQRTVFERKILLNCEWFEKNETFLIFKILPKHGRHGALRALIVENLGGRRAFQLAQPPEMPRHTEDYVFPWY
jgi:hypothetical protein